MIALASPRTRSEFSSPERNITGNAEENLTDEDESPTIATPRKKRVELDKGDVDGLGIHGQMDLMNS